ncbi:MAG: FHA domain-containing protein [Armatimonadota bacterium]|nr:FHA domain-containing protein [Armatimonadota bacterium]
MEIDQPQTEKTMVAQPAPVEATIIGTPIKCPVCGMENNPSEKYCGDCGFLLSMVPADATPIKDLSAFPKLVDKIRGREFFLHSGENAVGREAADILLEDPTVSRRHAIITFDESGCWVEDIGSTNGTFVNGRKVEKGEKIQIGDGAELKFGGSVLILNLPQVAPGVAEEASAIGEGTTAEAEAEQAEEAQTQLEKADEIASEQEKPVARLVVVSDPTKVFEIKPGVNDIGRRSSAAVPITFDGYVSSIHADLIAEADGFFITDMGSTNGTFVNGVRISPGMRSALSNGDEITVGMTTLRFEIFSAEGEPASSDTQPKLPEGNE